MISRKAAEVGYVSNMPKGSLGCRECKYLSTGSPEVNESHWCQLHHACVSIHGSCPKAERKP